MTNDMLLVQKRQCHAPFSMLSPKQLRWFLWRWNFIFFTEKQQICLYYMVSWQGNRRPKNVCIPKQATKSLHGVLQDLIRTSWRVIDIPMLCLG